MAAIRQSNLARMGVWLLAAVLLWATISAQDAVAQASQRKESSALAAALVMEKAVVDAIARCESSVVAIGIFVRDGLANNDGLPGRRRFNIDANDQTPSLEAIPDYYGTGVVIDRRGLILTNHHVVKQAGKGRIFIRVAGRPVWIEVTVKASDPYSDLAVLAIDAAQSGDLKLQPIPLGDATALRKGQFVITLGNPYAIARDGEVSAGWGIVSNTRRKAPPREGKPPQKSRPSMHHFGTLIQTDARLNLGTSGGALLNLQGEMVGLNTSMAALAGYEQSAGYAIPVDDSFRRAVRLLSEGREVEYGFLGISPDDLRHGERLRGATGVRVDSVVHGTPASGLLEAGDVITHINDQPIVTATDLMLNIGRQPAASRVKLNVLRYGQKRTVHITLTKNRVIGEKVVTSRPPAWRGLRVEFPAAMRSLDYRSSSIPSDCVMVEDVEPSSPAAMAGLRKGMLIGEVDGVAVATPAEFNQATADKDDEVRLRLFDVPRDLADLVVRPEDDTEHGS